jgi:hypothetical protein
LGKSSFAIGDRTISSGNSSTAMGISTVANRDYSTAIGMFNLGYNHSLFEVGMGIY